VFKKIKTEYECLHAATKKMWEREI